MPEQERMNAYVHDAGPVLDKPVDGWRLTHDPGPGGCQRKDPDASGDDINWNVGSSASVPGDVSGDTASGGEPSGDASGDTTSGDATQNGGRPVNSSGSGGGTTNGQTPNGDSSKRRRPAGTKLSRRASL